MGGPPRRAAQPTPRVHLTCSPSTQCPCSQWRVQEGAGGDCSRSSALQDRDFLEDEEFFLETLKKAAYNVTSH